MALKVPKEKRIKILDKIAELEVHHCDKCLRNPNYAVGGNINYCKKECEIGLKIGKLGIEYLGGKPFTKRDGKTVPIDKEKCIELYLSGYTNQQLALEFDVSEPTIRKRLREWGVPSRKELKQLKQK